MAPSIKTALQNLGIIALHTGEAKAADLIKTHRDAILKEAVRLQLNAEQELVTVITHNLPSGGVWGLGLRASVSKSITASMKQLVDDLGGKEPALLTAAHAWLEHQAASQLPK